MFFCFNRSTPQSAVAIQPVPVTNPFGTLPAMPQMSIGRAGTTPSVQYGISSMPVTITCSELNLFTIGCYIDFLLSFLCFHNVNQLCLIFTIILCYCH